MIIKLDTKDVKEHMDKEITNQIERIIKEKIKQETDIVINNIIKEKFSKENTKKLIERKIVDTVNDWYTKKDIKEIAAENLVNKIDIESFLDEDFKKEIIKTLNNKIKLVRWDIK